MKSAVVATLFAGAAGADVSANPLGQAVSLCNNLIATIEKDGEAEQKAYEEYFEWCDGAAKEKVFEIKTSSNQKAKLTASINSLAAQVKVCDTKVGELVEAIAANGKDLGAATKIRQEEAAIFAENQAELEDVVKTLSNAIRALNKQLGSAAFVQVSNGVGLQKVIQSLNALMDAASFTGSDKQKMLALVQSHQDAEEDDDAAGAPAAAVYKKTASGGVMDVLDDMKTKAEGQLDDLRKTEQSATFNYEALKQSLEDQLANDESEMAEQKLKKAGAQEGGATAQGELEVTDADLKTGQDALAEAQKNCMTVSGDHEKTVQSRNEELKVVKKAVDILKESTGAASFLQIETESSTENLKNKVAQFVRKYAKEHHSSEMMQLASRIMTVTRNSADPFGKIRGMIGDMIKKLKDEMATDATEKAYCDEEMPKAKAKKIYLTDTVSMLSNKIDKASAKSAALKEQVAVLQQELATLANEQASMDSIRRDNNAAYTESKADLTQGLDGVRKATGVLRDYYASNDAAAAALVQEEQPAMPQAHTPAGGAGGSIISILEVVESDMATELAKTEAAEQDEVAAYESTTQENKITKMSKDMDVKYKAQEAAALAKSVTELSNDRATSQLELDASIDYFSKLQGRCIAKPESYSDKTAKREAEITGLKEALEVLENEAALIQQASKKGSRNMRGGALQL